MKRKWFPILVIAMVTFSILALLPMAEAAGIPKRAISATNTFPWAEISKIGSVLNDILSPNAPYSFNSQRLTSLGTPTTAGDAQMVNMLQFNSLTTGTCLDGSPLEFQTSNSTWICGTDNGLLAAITSINSDTTAAQVFSGTSGNLTITDTGAGTLQWNIGDNLVNVGGSAQTVTKGLTTNALTLGGSMNAGSFAINNVDVTTVTGATTLSTDSEVILVNPSTTAFTITLPASSGNSGKHYRLIDIATTGTVVTIDGNGAETINGQTTVLLEHPYSQWDLYSDGSNWFGLFSNSILPEEKLFVDFDDFVSQGTLSDTGELSKFSWNWLSGGTAVVALIDSVTNHAGILNIQSGIVSADGTYLITGQSATIRMIGAMSDTHSVTWLLRVPTITTLDVRVGVAQTPTSAGWEGAQNESFLFDPGVSANWRCRTRDATTDQSTTTSVAVVANQWTKLKIVRDGGTVRFLIDDVNVCNHATNVPSSAGAIASGITTGAAAARNIHLDYVGWRIIQAR